MRLLVVEDEPKAVQWLAQGLGEAGFTVDTAVDGNDAVRKAMATAYDLVLLDIGLPGLDGWGVLRQLRGASDSAPVIVLTARDSIEDRVRGLEMGADDYIVKPCTFPELLARVRAVLRRESRRNDDPAPLRVADLELDRLHRRVIRAGRRIALSPAELSLLELFLQHRGEVLPPSFIAAEVFDMHDEPDPSAIRVAIFRLRSKIDEGFEPKLLHTVRGAGYLFDAP